VASYSRHDLDYCHSLKCDALLSWPEAMSVQIPVEICPLSLRLCSGKAGDSERALITKLTKHKGAVRSCCRSL